MNLLFDTNVYSELMRGRESVARLVRRSARLYLSAVVAGELLYGFRYGTRFASNLEELDAFCEKPYVSLVPVTRVTADRYSRIAAELRRTGTPIPTNDIWIAAHAMETGAELVSVDLHFAQIQGLVWTHLPSGSA